MGGVSLRYTQQDRYLGVTLDHKLSWKPHVMSKIVAAKQKISQTSQPHQQGGGTLSVHETMGIQRGHSPQHSPTSPVRECRSWENSTLQNELRKLNRKAMTMAIPKVYTTTPTRSMEIILKLPPLHLQIRRHARNAFLQTTDAT